MHIMQARRTTPENCGVCTASDCGMQSILNVKISGAVAWLNATALFLRVRKVMRLYGFICFISCDYGIIFLWGVSQFTNETGGICYG